MKKDGLAHGAKYVFVGLKGQGKDTEPEWTREVVAEKRGEAAMLGTNIGMKSHFSHIFIIFVSRLLRVTKTVLKLRALIEITIYTNEF